MQRIAKRLLALLLALLISASALTMTALAEDWRSQLRNAFGLEEDTESEPTPSPTPKPTPTPTPEPDPVMHVTSGKYTENQWSRNQITFDLELSSTPSDWGVSRFLEVFIVKEGESETHTVLQNNHYEPEDGNYKVYFAITDGNGKISSRTSTYTVMQDTTAPILIVQRTDGYGLIITAKDGISGL